MMVTGMPCVMVVDDVEDQRAIYRAVLERRGYRVIEAGDGEEAVRLAEADRPDAIVMDVGLPWMDGLEVTRRLKETPRMAAIPVLAVSAQREADTETRAAAVGCAAFMDKAVDPAGIADAIQALIGRAAA